MDADGHWTTFAAALAQDQINLLRRIVTDGDPGPHTVQLDLLTVWPLSRDDEGAEHHEGTLTLASVAQAVALLTDGIELPAPVPDGWRVVLFTVEALPPGALVVG